MEGDHGGQHARVGDQAARAQVRTRIDPVPRDFMIDVKYGVA